MKKTLMAAAVTLTLAALLVSCGKGEETTQEASSTEESSLIEDGSVQNTPASSDAETMEEVDTDGIFSFSIENVKEKLDELYPAETPHIYLLNASEIYEEFQIYYEEEETLTRLLDITCFSKENYTLEEIQATNIDSVYDGFMELSFTSGQVEESGDYIMMTLIFDDLDNADNVQAMVDHKILGFSGDVQEGIKAADYATFLREQEAIEFDPNTLQAIG